MADPSLQQTYLTALDALVERVKQDRSILAAVLCGSLSHDMVWTKSDIDLVLVTIDDRKVEARDLALYADGRNVHAFLMPRAEFRRTAEAATHNSFIHSFLTKGRLLYTHDPTIEALCARLSQLGGRDLRLERLRAATHAVGCLDKAAKWLVTRADVNYAALWLLYAATPLAQVEVLGAGRLVDREVIPNARALNPAFFDVIYTDLLNTPKTLEGVTAALEAARGYLGERAAGLFAPVIDHLREVGDARAASDLEAHFERHFNVIGVTAACEYLADQGLLVKASLPVQLTRRSNVHLQELAFFHASTAGHGA